MLGIHAATILIGSGRLTVSYRCSTASCTRDNAVCATSFLKQCQTQGGELRINGNQLVHIEADSEAGKCFAIIELECNELTDVSTKWMCHATHILLGSNKLPNFTCDRLLHSAMLNGRLVKRFREASRCVKMGH